MDGFAICKINNKGWNWINEKGEIILPNQWFDMLVVLMKDLQM